MAPSYLDFYTSGHNFGIFGAPGTGKSTLLKKLIHTSINNNKTIAITTPTGLSSINFTEFLNKCNNITTIDRFFHTEDGRFNSKEQINYIANAHPKSLQKYNNLDVLFIDEIGLVSLKKLQMVRELLLFYSISLILSNVLQQLLMVYILLVQYGLGNGNGWGGVGLGMGEWLLLQYKGS